MAACVTGLNSHESEPINGSKAILLVHLVFGLLVTVAISFSSRVSPSLPPSLLLLLFVAFVLYF